MTRLTLGLVVTLIASCPVVTSAQGAYMTYSSNTITVHRGSVPTQGVPVNPNDQFNPRILNDSEFDLVGVSTSEPVENDLDLKTSEEARTDALKACASAEATSTACDAALDDFLAALQREITGPDKTKNIDSAIGNFAYALYGAVNLSTLNPLLRTILSKAIEKLADAVTDTIQKSSIKQVASSVGQGKSVEKGAFYQNSASINTLAISPIELDASDEVEFGTLGGGRDVPVRFVNFGVGGM